MTEHELKMKKLTKAFHEVYLSVRNHPDQEAELGSYLLDSLGLMASRMANQGSESPKKVDWEPDDYKDLSDGLPVDVKTKFKKHNYKRFEKDELDELGELTPHQLKNIGG